MSLGLATICCTVTSFEQMYKDYIQPPNFTDEHLVWTSELLAKREDRLAHWDRRKYLNVLTDLYGRIRNSPSEGKKWTQHVRDLPLEMLDTMVVNCSAKAIVSGLLQPPQQSLPGT